MGQFSVYIIIMMWRVSVGDVSLGAEIEIYKINVEE